MAIVIAMSASVTVSIGELTIGVANLSFLVTYVLRFTCMGINISTLSPCEFPKPQSKLTQHGKLTDFVLQPNSLPQVQAIMQSSLRWCWHTLMQ